MTSPMRIRATEKDGEVDVRVLMKHDMETGQRKDEAGSLVAAWFIQRIDAKVGDKVVFSAEFGPSVSKDPFLHFKLKGSVKKGDALAITWADNKGESRTDKVDVR
jgi:sulfur-oxidizing protein SoxZ